MLDAEKEFLSKLLTALGIDPGPQGIDTFDRIVGLIKEAGAQKMAAAAVADGRLFPNEHAWFVEMAREVGLGAMTEFLNRRAKVVPIVRSPERINGVSQLDETQRQINRQVGLSDELFLKYHPVTELREKDEVQKHTNRQCGVSDELFAKYNARSG
jgi:Mu-like prophage I protein